MWEGGEGSGEAGGGGDGGGKVTQEHSRWSGSCALLPADSRVCRDTLATHPLLHAGEMPYHMPETSAR